MGLGIIVQIVACTLATMYAIGAMAVAVWTVHEDKQPQPVAYLEHVRDESAVLFVIENFGSGVATDIKITGFDYALVSKDKQDNVKRSFVENDISMLVPGARRDAVILTENDNVTDYLGISCAITLSHRERGLFGEAKLHKRKLMQDMGSFAGSQYTMSDFHNLVVATKSMAESLKKMSK